MKNITFLVGLLSALGFAAAAAAQEQKPLAPTPEAAAAPKPAAKRSAKPAAKPSASAARKSRRQEDARHCLQRPNNDEIIKCAEAYL